MLKAAIVGSGGISRSHVKGYNILEKEGIVKLVALYDIRPEAFSVQEEINLGQVDASTEGVHCYTDLEEMLQKEEIDFVDLCVPSFLHKELAVQFLNRGMNVLCEKPMSLHAADCEMMLKAQKTSGKQLMIAQCLRFFPEYEFLKACLDDGRYGKVLGAFFHRVGAQPLWGFERWYLNPERSGGAMTDLHIHDVDMVRYLFGEPEGVACCAADAKTKNDICHTTFYYGDLPVTAIGTWSPGRINFQSSYRVDFEKASLFYDGNQVTVYPENPEESSYVADTPGWDGYTGEIAYFAKVVAGEIINEKNPPESAKKTIELIEKMRESASRNGEKILLKRIGRI